MANTMFDPTDAGQQAAKDQILAIIAERKDTLGDICTASTVELNRLCAGDSWYTGTFRFMVQVVLTLMEEQKLLLNPENTEDPLSPGWKHLMGLVKNDDEILNEEESVKQAAMLFRAIMTEAVEALDDNDEESFKKEMDKVAPKVRDEMKAQIDQGGEAAIHIVKHLGNWLWMLHNEDACEAMNKRMMQLLSVGEGMKLELTGLIKLQTMLADTRQKMDSGMTLDEIAEEGLEDA